MPEPDDTDTMRLKIVRSVRDLFAIQSADKPPPLHSRPAAVAQSAAVICSVPDLPPSCKRSFCNANLHYFGCAGMATPCWGTRPTVEQCFGAKVDKSAADCWMWRNGDGAMGRGSSKAR